MARDPLLAQIHIAKKELALDDDSYRDVLERVTGARSSKDLSPAQRRKLISELKRLGFKPQGKFSGRKISDKPYVRKVFALWGELRRAGIWRNSDIASLRAFVKKLTGVADPEWLTYPQASMVIEAMKKMKERS